MEKMKKKNWPQLMRSVVAVMLAMIMVLCCGCNSKLEETTNPNALGDGDGKLEAQDFVDGFTKVYGTMLGAMGGQTDVSSHSAVDITVTLGDNLLSSLGYMLGQYGLPSDTSWLMKIGLNMDMNYTKDLTKMVLGLQLGDTKLVSAEIIQDAVGKMMYATLPGLHEQYLAYPMDISQDSVEIDTMGQIEDYAALVKALPTEEALNALLTRYLKLVMEQLEEPTVGKETLVCNGISQEVTATSHTIRRSDVLDMAEAVMKTAQTDAELEQMIDTLSEYYNAQSAKTAQANGTTWENVDLHQELMDEITYALEDIAETRVELEDADFLLCSVFADEKKDMGIRIKAIDESESIECSAYNLTQDSKTATLFEVKDLFRFTGSGTDIDGLASGEYTLSVEGTNMAYVEIKNFDTEALKDGDVKGTVSLKLTQEAIDEFFGYGAFVTPSTKLNIDFNLADESGDVEWKLYDGGVLKLGVLMSTKKLPAETITVPTEYVDAQEETAIYEWANGIDLNKVLDNLTQAGAPKELVDMLRMYLP